MWVFPEHYILFTNMILMLKLIKVDIFLTTSYTVENIYISTKVYFIRTWSVLYFKNLGISKVTSN